MRCKLGCRIPVNLPLPSSTRIPQVLEKQAAEAERGAATYGRGAQLLGESNQLLADAVQGLQQTQMMSMVGGGMAQHHGHAVWCLSRLNVALRCAVLYCAGCSSSMGHAPGAAAADISLQAASCHSGMPV